MALSCESARRLVTSYLDGELVGEDRSAFESHVEACDACRRVLRDEEAVVDAVTSALPRTPAPDGLRTRVDSLFPAAPRGRRLWPAGALAAGLALALAAGYLYRHEPPPGGAATASDLVAFAADTHLRYTRGQLPLEIGSDRPEAVSGWFAGRVPFSLTLPDYPVGPGESKLYRLLGGRLVSFRGDYAAYLAYRMEERPISLLVTSSQVRPEGGEVVRFASLVFHQESMQGLKIITWTDKGLTYALASDLSVGGERSCMVCHGSPEERRRIERFPRSPTT
jgi:anti-sigma factor (TIGR02949 family)